MERKQALEEHCVMAGHNSAIAQRDTLSRIRRSRKVGPGTSRRLAFMYDDAYMYQAFMYDDAYMYQA